MPEPAFDIILFDGLCGLCDGVVRFVLHHDRRAHFRFAALQSEVATALLRARGAEAGDSVVLISGEQALRRSDAVLAIAHRLGFPWSLAAGFRVVPRGWRDALYAGIARHRYRVFGRREACRVPDAVWRDRFLDASRSGDGGVTEG